jgi:hypothetical protein
MGRPLATVLALCCLCALAVPALAHVPAFGTDNASPATATHIDEPTKSWAIYERLDADGAAYFALDLAAGDRLYASVYTPDAARQPGLVVLSPAAIAGDEAGVDAVPSAVTVPEGYVATTVVSHPPSGAELEPFTPSSYYYTGDLDREVDVGGTYLLAVYERDGDPGPVGVAVGRSERFSVSEWLRVPFDVVRIHLWEGQSPLVVFGPGLLALAGAAAWLRRRWPATAAGSWRRRLTAGAALLVLAAAGNLAVQLGRAVFLAGLAPSALLPVVLVGVQVALGGWFLHRAGTGRGPLEGGTRVGLAAAGGLGLLVWAGYVLGPALAIVAAVVPRRS